MPAEQSTTDDPKPEGVEQRISRIREGLEHSFRHLDIIQDVMIVCAGKLQHQNAELDDSVANVLRRCGSDKLDEQLHELTEIIEDLGGRTKYSDDNQGVSSNDE